MYIQAYHPYTILPHIAAKVNAAICGIYNLILEVIDMKYRRIKDLREDNDITQKEIAGYLSVSRSAYQNYESDMRKIPVDILSKIADYYNTSVDYLINRTDEPKPYPNKINE